LLEALMTCRDEKDCGTLTLAFPVPGRMFTW
jgi:hypothetical protein